ncbi:MAG: hypothetical protein WKF47_14350 [Geodermatophilaceae bacterium]
MPDATVSFVADDSSTPTFGSAIGSLSPRFSVESSAARQVTRFWLDTDDWRLHNAGMVLEHTETPADDPRLVLHDAQGRRHTQPAQHDLVARPDRCAARGPRAFAHRECRRHSRPLGRS